MSSDDDSVIYSSRTFVRSHRWWDASWVDWNYRYRGGPVLTVRHDSFEVSATQGMMMESRHFIVSSSTATMWFDIVGWAGTPFGRRRSIHIVWRNKRGRKIELALSPDDGLQEAWEALLQSGVTLEVGRSAPPPDSSDA